MKRILRLVPDVWYMRALAGFAVLWVLACLLTCLVAGCARPNKTAEFDQAALYGVVRQAVKDEIIEYQRTLEQMRAKRIEEFRLRVEKLEREGTRT